MTPPHSLVLRPCHQAWPPQRGKGSPLLCSFRESPGCPPWGHHSVGISLWACPRGLGNQSSCWLPEEENGLKAILCYFIEGAFIHILKAFIRKTTGAERRQPQLEGAVPCKVSTPAVTATNRTFTPSEGLTWWGLQKERAHFVGLPEPLQEEAAQTPTFLSLVWTP